MVTASDAGATALWPSTTLRLLVIVPSLVTAGFGVWHFFVPSLWNWYAAIAPDATELVRAVRAINFFFSLCLVLQGALNIALVLHRPTERFALTLMLGASSVLWASRVVLQLLYPQGSQIPAVAPIMLVTFALTFAAFATALVVVVRGP